MKRIILASIATLALSGYALAENAVPPQASPNAGAVETYKAEQGTHAPFLAQFDRTTTASIPSQEHQNPMYETPRANLTR